MHIDDSENMSTVSNRFCECSVTGEVVEGQSDKVTGRSYTADPNTHLLYPKTMIPAVEYRIARGRSILKTVVKSDWYSI